MLNASILSILMLLAPSLPKVKLLDTCHLGTADATATLGVANNGSAADHFGRGYEVEGRTCRRFVADFAVAPNAAALAPALSEYFSVDGDIAKGAMPTNSDACAALTVSTVIYKKAAGQSSFVKVGGSVQKGIWNAANGATSGFIDGTCTLASKSGAAVVGTPNKAGQDIYRTAVQTNAAGLATGVRGSIMFVAPPPS